MKEGKPKFLASYFYKNFQHSIGRGCYGWKAELWRTPKGYTIIFKCVMSPSSAAVCCRSCPSMTRSKIPELYDDITNSSDNPVDCGLSGLFALAGYSLKKILKLKYGRLLATLHYDASYMSRGVAYNWLTELRQNRKGYTIVVERRSPISYFSDGYEVIQGFSLQDLYKNFVSNHLLKESITSLFKKANLEREGGFFADSILSP